jgi:hypothetical protein
MFERHRCKQRKVVDNARNIRSPYQGRNGRTSAVSEASDTSKVIQRARSGPEHRPRSRQIATCRTELGCGVDILDEFLPLQPTVIHKQGPDGKFGDSEVLGGILLRFGGDVIFQKRVQRRERA